MAPELLFASKEHSLEALCTQLSAVTGTEWIITDSGVTTRLKNQDEASVLNTALTELMAAEPRPTLETVDHGKKGVSCSLPITSVQDFDWFCSDMATQCYILGEYFDKKLERVVQNNQTAAILAALDKVYAVVDFTDKDGVQLFLPTKHDAEKLRKIMNKTGGSYGDEVLVYEHGGKKYYGLDIQKLTPDQKSYNIAYLYLTQYVRKPVLAIEDKPEHDDKLLAFISEQKAQLQRV
ncbi:MAG: hypothetical protein SFT92_00060 [Rickettsiales bacterium]|nr:hypothetical protein [Rickettsiales bacterium]